MKTNILLIVALILYFHISGNGQKAGERRSKNIEMPTKTSTIETRGGNTTRGPSGKGVGEGGSEQLSGQATTKSSPHPSDQPPIILSTISTDAIIEIDKILGAAKTLSNLSLLNGLISGTNSDWPSTKEVIKNLNQATALRIENIALDASGKISDKITNERNLGHDTKNLFNEKLRWDTFTKSLYTFGNLPPIITSIESFDINNYSEYDQELKIYPKISIRNCQFSIMYGRIKQHVNRKEINVGRFDAKNLDCNENECVSPDGFFLSKDLATLKFIKPDVEKAPVTYKLEINIMVVYPNGAETTVGDSYMVEGFILGNKFVVTKKSQFSYIGMPVYKP